MLKRTVLLVALALLSTIPARAGDPPPSFVVRVKSLDTLVENAKLLVSLAGREEIAQQVEGLVKARIGAKGLEGIDPTRPLGAYGRFGKELTDISGAALIPIADDKALLALLANLNINVVKGNNDIYTIQTGTPIEIYLRFANRYAYVTAMNPAAIEGKLVDPAKVLGGGDGPAFSGTFRLDQIPDAARQLAVAKIEDDLRAAAGQDMPGETPAQKALRQAAAREFTKTIVGIINDGAELNLGIDLNAKTKELNASLSVAGKAQSELANSLRKLGQRPSQFAGLKRGDAALHGQLHFALPDEIRLSFLKVIDEGIQKGVANIQDAAKRQQAQRFIDAINPTLKSGEVDGFIQAIGPSADRTYTVLAGVKIAEGVKLGGTIHDLLSESLQQAPPQIQDLVKLNAASAGDVKIHRITLPDNQEPVRKLKEALGEANVYIAFRDDALLLAAGRDGLATLQKAVVVKAAGASPVMQLDIDVARLAPYVAPTEELRAAAQKLFPDGRDGQVRVTVEGGAALRLNLSMRLAVVQFFSKAHELKASQ